MYVCTHVHVHVNCACIDRGHVQYLEIKEGPIKYMCNVRGQCIRGSHNVISVTYPQEILYRCNLNQLHVVTIKKKLMN